MRIRKSSLLVFFTFISGLIIASFFLSELIFEQRTPSLLSFTIIHGMGYLFFFIMPVEVLFMYYLFSGASWYLLFPLAICSAFFSLTINFLIGRSVRSDYLINFIGQKRFDKSKRFLEKYGKGIIFGFTSTMLSSPIIILVSGILKLPARLVLIYSILGLTFKYSLLVLAYFVFV